MKVLSGLLEVKSRYWTEKLEIVDLRILIAELTVLGLLQGL